MDPRLETKDPEDELILAQIEPRKTLRETYEKIMALVSMKEKIPLSAAEVLLVPTMNFQVQHDYQELLGKTIIWPNDRARIVEARSTVKFMLDVHGAREKSFFHLRGGKSLPIELVFD